MDTVTAQTNELLQRIQEQEAEIQSLRLSKDLQGRLIASVLHDIRSPLNVVMVATNVVCDDTVRPERRKRNAQLLLDAADSINTLCQDTLDYSKLSAGEMELNLKNFDLHECLHNVTEGLSLLAQKKGIEIITHLSPECPQQVLGDPGRFRQILVNLLSNALKFTLQGHIEVRVQPLPCEALDQKVHLGFYVSDTGLGIHEDKLEGLFGAYRQAHDELSTELGGAGLGLAIASRLANCMGGQLSATSRAGRGTCFSFDAYFGKAENPSHTERSPIRGKRILILDEVPETRADLESVCLALGMHPVVVSDGVEAVRLLEEANQKSCAFPLAIFNLESGGGDALFVVEQIHPERRKTTQFLAYALNGQSADLALCEEAGLQGYLCGPIDESTLEGTLRKMLEGRDSEAVVIFKAAEVACNA